MDQGSRESKTRSESSIDHTGLGIGLGVLFGCLLFGALLLVFCLIRRRKLIKAADVTYNGYQESTLARNLKSGPESISILGRTNDRYTLETSEGKEEEPLTVLWIDRDLNIIQSKICVDDSSVSINEDRFQNQNCEYSSLDRFAMSLNSTAGAGSLSLDLSGIKGSSLCNLLTAESIRLRNRKNSFGTVLELSDTGHRIDSIADLKIRSIEKKPVLNFIQDSSQYSFAAVESVKCGEADVNVLDANDVIEVGTDSHINHAQQQASAFRLSPISLKSINASIISQDSSIDSPNTGIGSHNSPKDGPNVSTGHINSTEDIPNSGTGSKKSTKDIQNASIESQLSLKDSQITSSMVETSEMSGNMDVKLSAKISKLAFSHKNICSKDQPLEDGSDSSNILIQDQNDDKNDNFKCLDSSNLTKSSKVPIRTHGNNTEDHTECLNLESSRLPMSSKIPIRNQDNVELEKDPSESLIRNEDKQAEEDRFGPNSPSYSTSLDRSGSKIPESNQGKVVLKEDELVPTDTSLLTKCSRILISNQNQLKDDQKKEKEDFSKSLDSSRFSKSKIPIKTDNLLCSSQTNGANNIPLLTEDSIHESASKISQTSHRTSESPKLTVVRRNNENKENGPNEFSDKMGRSRIPPPAHSVPCKDESRSDSNPQSQIQRSMGLQGKTEDTTVAKGGRLLPQLESGSKLLEWDSTYEELKTGRSTGRLVLTPRPRLRPIIPCDSSTPAKYDSASSDDSVASHQSSNSKQSLQWDESCDILDVSPSPLDHSQGYYTASEM